MSALADPRYNTRNYLLTYLDTGTYPSLGYIYLDNGSTEAEYAVMYAKPNVPLKLLYYGNKNYDVIFTIGEPDNQPAQDWQHKTYRYTEQVPISISAVDKDGLTAQFVLWQAERKLRLIVETYFTGNLRTLKRTKPNQQYLGGFFEYTVDCMLSYVRPADVVPTYPTLTWGDSDGTFVFPNVTAFEMHPLSNNTHGTIPGRKCSATQKLGLPDYQLKFTCDLDTEPSTKTWKRPQATTPKTDIINSQVFKDIYYGSQTTEEYQTLNLGWGTTIKVTLEEPHLYMNGDRHMIDLVMYSYNTTEPATYKALFGINP